MLQTPQPYYLRLRELGRCARALPAAVFDLLEVRPSRSTLLDALAARALVTLLRLLLGMMKFY